MISYSSFAFFPSILPGRVVTALIALGCVAAVAYQPVSSYTGPEFSVSVPLEVEPSQNPLGSAGISSSNMTVMQITKPTLSSVTVTPTSVIGGSTSQGLVSLTAPAPPNGAKVILTSNSPYVSVPGSIKILAGTRQASFTVRTFATNFSLVGLISGVYGEVSRSAALTVLRVTTLPPVLSSISLSPDTVTGGGNSTATVTLSQPAPAGGAVVTLSSNNSAIITIPASVTVPAGSLSATLTVATISVTASTSPTISAAYGGESRNAVLTILPGGASLVFSGYLGGGGEDSVRDIATDTLGNVYVTGGTASSNFPTTIGAYDTSFNGTMDAFVAKIDPSGSLVWATFIGGPNYDRAYAIEVDATGVYIAGRAGAGFPTTAGALQTAFAGDNAPNGAYGPQDGFVAKFSLDGARMWATYVGGPGRGFIRDVAIDSNRNVYCALSSVRAGFQHISTGAFDTTHNGSDDGAVVKINASGANLIYGTYIGGSANDGGGPSVRVNAAGEAFFLQDSASLNIPVTQGCFQPVKGSGTTSDVHLSKLSANGSQLLFATYIGGSNAEFSETHGLEIDPSGNAYIAITTKSTSLPTTANAFQNSYGGSGGSGTGSGTNYPGDLYLGKISADGRTLLAGTYLGGRYGEGAEGIALDSQGNVYVSGATYSDNFPVSGDAFQATIVGDADLFVAKLTGDLRQLRYSSYIGGHLADYGRTLAIDSSGKIYVAGSSLSIDWPLNNPFQSFKDAGWDGVLTKISP